jgi:hypothetical protein
VVVAAATEQIHQLIESRTASRTKANAQAASWSASERRYKARKREQNQLDVDKTLRPAVGQPRPACGPLQTARRRFVRRGMYQPFDQ